MNAPTSSTALKPKDYASPLDVRWCPGCGDYSILAQTRKVLADAKIPTESCVFVSGIGCSSRFPYYLATYGFHTIHGRAPAVATGIKLSNPKLQVWVATGDGDALSIGGNHILHVMRRNVDLNILLFNNRIYGLTKGQYSPTSEFGKRTKSSPYGSVDNPFDAIRIVLAAGATFVARAVDADVKVLAEVIRRASEHRGISFVEIYQDCNVYNHGAYEFAANKATRADNVLYLEHGKPLIFGKDRNKGIRLNVLDPEVVTIGEGGVTEADILVYDETSLNMAQILAEMHYPDFPEPAGVFRDFEAPVFDQLVHRQLREIKEKRGAGHLDELFRSSHTWTVR